MFRSVRRIACRPQGRILGTCRHGGTVEALVMRGISRVPDYSRVRPRCEPGGGQRPYGASAQDGRRASA